MKYFLKHPLSNAVCISLFTLFYGLIFILTSRHIEFGSLLYYKDTANKANTFWESWSSFLASGKHSYIAYIMFAITILIVILLMLRRHPYDEYHTSLLVQCLAVAVILTLIAIAIFYLLVLSDPNGIIEKFTLFIAIHWITVVLADLVYVILCRWK
jgi:heme exporter protein D